MFFKKTLILAVEASIVQSIKKFFSSFSSLCISPSALLSWYVGTYVAYYVRLERYVVILRTACWNMDFTLTNEFVVNFSWKCMHHVFWITTLRCCWHLKKDELVQALSRSICKPRSDLLKIGKCRKGPHNNTNLGTNTKQKVQRSSKHHDRQINEKMLSKKYNSEDDWIFIHYIWHTRKSIICWMQNRVEKHFDLN